MHTYHTVRWSTINLLEIAWNSTDNVLSLREKRNKQTRGVVTALKPVRAEQVRRPERKQNWTVSVGSIHIIIETVLIISCSPRADIGGPTCQSITHPPYNMKYFYSFLALSFNSIFNFFLTEGAQYECSYRRTAHHAAETNKHGSKPDPAGRSACREWISSLLWPARSCRWCA